MTHAPNSIAARDIAYALHGYTNMEAHEQKGPVVITRGNGIHVYDDEDNFEGLDLVASEEPGTWVAYRVEEIRVNVYGKGFRVVDVRMLISPIHDSHARFGPAMYECWCRIEA